AGDQLERAVVGAQTAVCSAAAAEGAERRRLFRGALSEASEAGGATDTAPAYGALTRPEYETLRQTLLRLCACLYRLPHPRRPPGAPSVGACSGARSAKRPRRAAPPTPRPPTAR